MDFEAQSPDELGAFCDEQRQALALRNRLLTLLIDRVKRVRKAAQYVFRNFPDIARKFTSPYERRQRTARRKATAEAGQSAAGAAQAVHGSAPAGTAGTAPVR